MIAPTRASVFSHANGFPAGTYRVIFAAWRAAGFHLHAIEKLGHDPRCPVTGNWPNLRDQLIHFIDREVRACEQILHTRSCTPNGAARRCKCSP